MPVRRTSNLQEGDEEESQQQQQQRQRRRRKQSRRKGGFGDQATSSRRQVVQPQQDKTVEAEQQEDQPQSGDIDPVQQNPEEDSDDSGTDPEDFDEVVKLFRADLRNNDFNERHFFAQFFEARKDVDCPICLGIIKKTRTVMECLHRFCQVCIDKSMRLGKNECPACRIHCASRRSLRDDLDYDALIDAIYPDVDNYEKEELVMHEEDQTRKEQIQASIAEICSRRQSDELPKKLRSERDTDDVPAARVPCGGRNSHSRRRNARTNLEGHDGNERDNDHNGNENPSPADNHGTEVTPRRRKRRTLPQPSTSSPLTAAPNGVENSTVQIREVIGNPLGLIHNPEMLTWGRGGARSHTRHGSASGSRGNKGTQVRKLTDHLDNLRTNDTESDIQLSLISLDKERLPDLKQPYLCCESNLSVEHLCQHVAQETKAEAGDVQMLSIERAKAVGKSTDKSSNSANAQNSESEVPNWPNARLQVLEGQESLAALSRSSNTKEMILAYGRKKDPSQI